MTDVNKAKDVEAENGEQTRRSSHCSTVIDYPEDCAFQLSINGRIVVDEVLITRPRANALWSQYKPEFVAAVERCDYAEVALWVEMINDTNFQRALFHIGSDECVMDGGKCFVKRPLP